jgi:hypothetical protein
MNDESQTTFCGKPFDANQPPLIIAEVGFITTETLSWPAE